MKLFVSWSGKPSRSIGKALKRWLCESVFPGEELDVFISDEDIDAGSDWLSVIKGELQCSDCAIIVLTKDNIRAPWLNFEAGSVAMSNEEKRAIPLLIDVNSDEIHTPLKHYQGVTLSESGIKKLIHDLKEFGGFTSPSHIADSIGRLHAEISAEVANILADIDEQYYEDEFVIFPKQVKKIKKGKVFVGVPMASADDAEYPEYKTCALDVKNALLEYGGAKEVYCPSESIPNRGKFDGYRKAIRKDFQILKESEHYVFIYPRNINSSILVEMGYAIALSKNTTIFAKSIEELPFMLKKADIAISNLIIYEYSSTEDIVDIIKMEGEEFLNREAGE